VCIAFVLFVAAGCSRDDAGSGARTPSRPAATAPPSVSSPSAKAPAPSTPPTTVRTEFPPGTFDPADAALDARVRSAGLAGGLLRITAVDGTVLHEHQVGAVGPTTPLAVASSTKWLTAALLMTFVDQGAIGLDDDIARWLPEFGGSDPPVTARMLLSHTSGVRDHRCQDDGTALAPCVRTLATSPREFTPGSAFSYGNSPFLVVGRLVEVLSGTDFASAADARLTGPLGMTDTTWPGAPGAPNPAFGVRTTVDDYGRFLAMLLRDGAAADGTRLLSPAAVAQLVTDQVGAYDTTGDYSVGITGIPRYALGAWPDVVDPAGRTLVVSGNGGKGLYPWIDFTSRTWGIVGVQDDRGAEVAVPASQQVATAAWTAIAPP
jgi:CubicO group peptidase (beta-lactamase class C family)